MKSKYLNAVQKNCISEIISNFKTEQKQMLAWYTGSGKTNIFLGLCKELIRNNPKVRIGISAYLHVNIKNQVAQRSKLFGLEPKVLMSSNDYEDANLYIFNPQCAYIMKESLNLDYLIIDEAHIGTSEDRNLYYSEVIRIHCKKNYKLLGASATPWDALSNSMFEGAKVFKRGLNVGFSEDKRIQDFKIHAERMEVKIKESDYTRDGDISTVFIAKNFDTVKRISKEKINRIIFKHKKLIGNKCLIIVSPGRECEIAKEVSEMLGNQADYLIGGKALSSDSYLKREEKVIYDFKNDPSKKFLVVVNKCQIGFDMPELSSTIDLTMSRNIKLVVQRWGRLARKTGNDKAKNYFYVFDDGIEPERVEWILGTSIEYAMCRWSENLSNRKIKNRETDIYNISNGNKSFQTSLSDLFQKYEFKSHETYKTIKFSSHAGYRNSFEKEDLISRAISHPDRTALSKKDRVTYNKLRKKYPEELEKLFPIKHQLGKWTLESVKKVASQYKNMSELRKNYSGAHEAILTKKWQSHIKFKGSDNDRN